MVGPPLHTAINVLEIAWEENPQEQRSEEHTSELQSVAYNVCRLLLENNKRVHNQKESGKYEPADAVINRRNKYTVNYRRRGRGAGYLR